MAFYSFEMILVGIILLSAMAFGGIKLWLNKRANSEVRSNFTDDQKSNSIS